MPADVTNELVLVTAASGKQAAAILPQLTSLGFKRLRLQCFSSTSADRLRQSYPEAEIVQTGLDTLEIARRLMDGVSACFVILPAFHPRETQYGINMVDAAIENGRHGGPFKHFVYSSVLHSNLRSLANHENKRYVEEALVESGIEYTVVQPTHLMENVPIGSIVSSVEPVFPARFDPLIRFSFLSATDLGEAVAKIIREREKHFYATYQLVSTASPLSYEEAMGIVSEEIGKPVRIEQLSLEEIRDGYLATQSASDEEKKVIGRHLVRLMSYYNTQGLIGNSSVLALVLEREPTGYRDWVRKAVRDSK